MVQDNTEIVQKMHTMVIDQLAEHFEGNTPDHVRFEIATAIFPELMDLVETSLDGVIEIIQSLNKVRGRVHDPAS